MRPERASALQAAGTSGRVAALDLGKVQCAPDHSDQLRPPGGRTIFGREFQKTALFLQDRTGRRRGDTAGLAAFPELCL